MTIDPKDITADWQTVDLTMRVQIKRVATTSAIFRHPVPGAARHWFPGAVLADEHTTMTPVRPTLPTALGSIATDDAGDDWALTVRGWRCYGDDDTVVANDAWLTKHIVSVEDAGWVMTDYKPGALYLATVRGQADVLVTWINPTGIAGWPWHSAVRVGGGLLHAESTVTDVRPAYVLAADEVAVKRADLEDVVDSAYVVSSVTRTRLRALLAPPRPTLPTALGSIVTDIEGHGWVLTAKGWLCYGDGAFGVDDTHWLADRVASVEDAGAGS